MTLFESIVSACAVAYVFTRVYDWVEWQISQHLEKGEATDERA
jgi:hypothetical protein